LAEARPSAPAYCLLGIVCQALGDLESARAGFDRALYLDPRHYESLVHAAFIHERAGRAELATTLRRRAERCRVAGGVP
jgi:chemotaxis protein methyltransferase WspC